MKVCYLIQTHKNPDQVCRLISKIQETSQGCFILINHDYTNCEFPSSLLESFSQVAIIPKTAQGFRSDFSLIQAYLDSVEWLFENQINFDWLVNLSGQDYPAKSPREFEQMLAQSTSDGYTEYFEILSQDSPLGKPGQERYYYQYWRSSTQPNFWQNIILKPLKIIVNNSQPWLKINTGYGLSVGVKAKNPPFNEDQFRCYGGSFHHVLSHRAVSYLFEQTKENPQLVNYYQKTIVPDESYMKTILLNSPDLKITNSKWMYFDFSGTKFGHPRTLNKEDLPKIIESNAYFARKFDSVNDEVLDLLDSYIIEEKDQLSAQDN